MTIIIAILTTIMIVKKQFKQIKEWGKQTKSGANLLHMRIKPLGRIDLRKPH